MPAYHVERSIRIDAAEPAVRPAIEDFRQWPTWSPWLCMEPDAKMTYHGKAGETGHGYDWDGDLVGAGGMRLASNEGNQLKMDLNFLRPFKSNADVQFEVKPVGDNQTEVTWHLDGKMPFFLFWMTGTMKTMIGMDYARGLKMLKEYVETGKVLSKTEIAGIVDVPQMHYVGVSDQCTIDEIGESMQRTLPAAHKFATESESAIAGPPGALWDEVDLKTQAFKYTAIVPVESSQDIAGAQTGTIAPCKAIKVTHTGSYQNVGNAWSTVMAYQRYKKLKPLKSQCGFELYVNDPCETAEADLLTEIYLPIRG